jgi:hypothetical protein
MNGRTTLPIPGSQSCLARPRLSCRRAVIGKVQQRITAASGRAMHWSEIEKSQPRLGQLGRQRLIEPGVVLVATIRRDGTPRLSPVEPSSWTVSCGCP